MLFNGNRIYILVAEYRKLEYPININSGGSLNEKR